MFLVIPSGYARRTMRSLPPMGLPSRYDFSSRSGPCPAHRHLVPRLRAPRRPFGTCRAAQAERLRRAAELSSSASFNERALRLIVPGGRGQGLRAPVPAHLCARAGRLLHPRPARRSRVLRHPVADRQRDGDRQGPAVHRAHDRPGQPARRGRAPLRRRPRARAHPVRARGLPDDAADPHPALRPDRLDADRVPRACGPSSGGSRSGSASPSSPATGPGCWPARTWTRPGAR